MPLAGLKLRTGVTTDREQRQTGPGFIPGMATEDGLHFEEEVNLSGPHYVR